jgi:hypothetical protein
MNETTHFFWNGGLTPNETTQIESLIICILSFIQSSTTGIVNFYITASLNMDLDNFKTHRLILIPEYKD